MQITKSDIQRAIDDASDPWAISDRLLYGLCAEYPNHHNLKAVTAKMLLIGRAYAATAERGRSAGETAGSSNDEFYTRQLPGALKGSGLDGVLASLRPFETISNENTDLVIRAHTELLSLIHI